jgi:hypothetical protein
MQIVQLSLLLVASLLVHNHNAIDTAKRLFFQSAPEVIGGKYHCQWQLLYVMEFKSRLGSVPDTPARELRCAKDSCPTLC